MNSRRIPTLNFTYKSNNENVNVDINDVTKNNDIKKVSKIYRDIFGPTPAFEAGEKSKYIEGERRLFTCIKDGYRENEASINQKLSSWQTIALSVLSLGTYYLFLKVEERQLHNKINNMSKIHHDFELHICIESIKEVSNFSERILGISKNIFLTAADEPEISIIKSVKSADEFRNALATWTEAPQGQVSTFQGLEVQAHDLSELKKLRSLAMMENASSYFNDAFATKQAGKEGADSSMRCDNFGPLA